MKDGLGRPQAVLLIGGTSEIGLAIVRRLRPSQRAILAGRPSQLLTRSSDDLVSALGVAVTTVDLDLDLTDTHRAALDAAFAAGDIDVVIVAAGVLGDQAAFLDRPEEAVNMARVTYLGAMSIALHAGRLLAGQGHGDVILLSSVAADRPRPATFVYGSAKAGLDSLGRGLHDALAPSGVGVLVVRPGFVRTRMTEGLPAAPFSTDPDPVAEDVVDALRRGRRVVYSPGILRPVMTAIRLMPSAVVRRLPR